MEKFVLILSQIFMYFGILVLLYIVYRVKNLKVQAPLDYNPVSTKHASEVSSPPQVSSSTIIQYLPPKDIRYEYDIIHIQYTYDAVTSHDMFINGIKNILATKSEEGWELICVDNDKYIFKKPKNEQMQ